MRPVDRGPVPLVDGVNPRVYDHYRDARDELIARIGDYCSYCEMAFPVPAVEHVQPKSLQPGLERVWDNFLLGCTSCNSIKGDKPVTLADYYWPDAGNTARAFVYDTDEPPRVNPAVADQARARRTLDLTGLDRVPGHPDYSERDRRWIKRREVWGIALRSHQQLQQNDSPALREQIVYTAISRGFFSVWMTVFRADTEMRCRLINAFRGTSSSCFNREGNPVLRPGGAI
jgi:hypothetical protein